MIDPTPEQVEAARAEYDRSEDMCAALVAAAELTGEIARPGHDDSYRRERAEQATEEEPAQPRPPFLLSQSRVNESESDPENSEGNNAGHASTIRGVTPPEPGEPTYSTDTRQWSGSCPCIRAEQVDPECEWHGRPEFRRGGALHSNALSIAIVNEAKLAEVIDDAFTERRPYEGIAAGAARRAVERQDEWLRGGGQ